MSTRVSAPTKGLIRNNDTGEIRRFQFNPEGFRYSRSVNYATVDAPGMEYPDTQFVKGNVREFTMELFFYDRPFTNKFKEYTWFFGNLLTQETNHLNFEKPPEMTLAIGNWVRRCVLTSLDINVEMYDPDLNPVMFRCTLGIRQVR